MEKLKNLVNPGSKEDDEVMYGSGRSEDPVYSGHTHTGSALTGSGQGSHLGSSRTAGQDPSSASSKVAGISQHNTTITGGASHGLSEPYASRMPGAFDDDDAATTASVSSGIPGRSQSRSATAGAHDPAFIEKPLPRKPASGTGIGHGQSSLTANTYPDRSVESKSTYGDHSGLSHLGRDAALAAGAAGTSAHRHEDPRRDNYATETDRSFPLGGKSSSDKNGSTTTGPHPSSLANKKSPLVDSDGSHTTRSPGYRSIAEGYGSSIADPHSLGLANKADSRVDSDGSRSAGYPGYGSGTGATPRRDEVGPAVPTGVGARAGAVGSGSIRGTEYGHESWQHAHDQHGHRYEGDPCETGVTSEEGPHFVAGPHVTDTANRLDPRVNSGFEGSATTGESTGESRGNHHPGHNANCGASAIGLGAIEADHGKVATTGHIASRLGSANSDHHDRDPTGAGAYNDDGRTSTGALSTGKTAGPHKSDTLNKLDPRVDSDLSKQQGSHGSDHQFGRDATLTGVGGTGMYEAEKHYRSNESNLATPTTTIGMGDQKSYGSGVDPRIGGAQSGTSREGSAVSPAGSSHQPATASDHHYRRDAGLVSAGGIGTYEATKHLGSSDHSDLAATPQDRLAGSGHQPATATSSSSHPSTGYRTVDQPQSGSHVEGQPLNAGGIGARVTGKEEKAQNIKAYGRSGPETQVQEHQHSGSSVANHPSSVYGNDFRKEENTSHHKGKEAALVGAGVGVGAGVLAGHENPEKDVIGYGNEPSKEGSGGYRTSKDTAAIAMPGTGATQDEDTRHGHHVSKEIAAPGGARASASPLAGDAHSQRDVAGHGIEPYQSTSQEYSTSRDAAILSSAAGMGGLAGHEYSEKNASKLQKEHTKEEKAFEKERSKEVKHRNKELAKAEKAHDKTVDKYEKKHEKVIDKDETKQEHGGRKHGGILGFLHRDKPDKELKEEEATRQGATHPGSGGDVAAGTGATGLESRGGNDPPQGEHGNQSGVHDVPIGMGSGLTTHDAYGAHDSGHNKLHKDPPSKIVESRGYEFQ